MVKEWAVGAGTLFAVATVVRIVCVGKAWRRWVPGGIAVAVGKLNLVLTIPICRPLIVMNYRDV